VSYELEGNEDWQYEIHQPSPARGVALEIFSIRKSFGARAEGAIGEQSGSDCDRGANRFSGKISSVASLLGTLSFWL
jgi:hypothetical protein